MVLTVYSVLSSVTGLFCHRRQRIKFCLSPVGPTQLRELDASVGASGPHDFAVREKRLSSARRLSLKSLSTSPAIPSRAKRCRVHRNPPRVRDDHDTPLLWDGMARLIEMFLPTMEAKYFCKEGWTPLSTNRPTGKSLEPILLSACPRCLFSLVSRTEIRPSFPDVQNCTSWNDAGV